MPTPVPPSDHRITLEEATDIVRRYRESDPAARPAPTFVFHRMAYDRILRQPACEAIRMYPALHVDGRQTVVMVGVDDQGRDMLGELAQFPEECPPTCDESSVLSGAR